MLLIAVATSLAFASCSDSTDNEDFIIDINYTVGFNRLSYNINAVVVNEELQEIKATYLEALGVETEPFTLHGSVPNCDAKVIAAAQSAYQKLKDRTWQATCEISIRNSYTGQSIYTQRFGPDAE